MELFYYAMGAALLGIFGLAFQEGAEQNGEEGLAGGALFCWLLMAMCYLGSGALTLFMLDKLV